MIVVIWPWASMTSWPPSVPWGTIHCAPWVPCKQVHLLTQVPHPVNYKIMLGKAQKGEEKLLQTLEAPMQIESSFEEAIRQYFLILAKRWVKKQIMLFEWWSTHRGYNASFFFRKSDLCLTVNEENVAKFSLLSQTFQDSYWHKGCLFALSDVFHWWLKFPF